MSIQFEPIMRKELSQNILHNIEEEVHGEIMEKIARNTSNAVVITRLDGRISYVNEGFEILTEYTLEEVFGMAPEDMFKGPDTDAQTLKQIIARLKKLERVNETLLVYSKTFKPYWLNLDIFPLFDHENRPVYFMAIVCNVTQLKENERLAREQNERIKENISYARLLQGALFRNQNELSTLFDDFFIIDEPKDEVGGDFYLAKNIQGKKVILLGDCTGHGVSGAILTALSISTIQETLDTYKTLDPEIVLLKSLKKLQALLSGGESEMRDSFEATLLFIDENKKVIRYASTSQSIYLLGNETENLIRKKRGHHTDSEAVAIKGSLNYEPGTMIYLSSDGFQDQFGGPKSRKFGSTEMLKMFAGQFQVNGEQQKEVYMKTLRNWQGSEYQTDDVLLMGLRLR